MKHAGPSSHAPHPQENKEKIKLNKQLPYLVGNVVEVLDVAGEDDGCVCVCVSCAESRLPHTQKRGCHDDQFQSVSTSMS